MTAQTPLTAAQRRAAEILAMNDVYQMTHAEIAQEVGVSERTLYRWKNDPAFNEYLDQITAEIMRNFTAEASVELRRIVRSSDSDNVRLKGIELAYKFNGKLKDVKDQTVKIQDDRSNEAIEAEIADLKKQLGMN